MTEDDDDRVRQAFADLAARASTAATADTAAARPDRRQVPSSHVGSRRLTGMVGVAAAAAVIAGSALWLATPDGDDGIEVAAEATTTAVSIDEAGGVAADDGDIAASPDRATRFDPRAVADEVFVVSETGDGVVAGFTSSIDEPLGLPAETVAAAPDGIGGVVFVTDHEVWLVPPGATEPTLAESVEIPVHFVGPRTVDGETAVYVLIGSKLIGYRSDGQRGPGVAFQTSDILHLDVDGPNAVGVVDRDGQVMVVAWDLATGRSRDLTEAVPPTDDDAPRMVALDRDRAVVVDGTTTARILSLDPDDVDPSTAGSDIGTVALPIDPDDVIASPSGDDGPAGLQMMLDLVASQLLVTFGEASLVVDLDSQERAVVGDTPGWVRSAVWASSTPAVVPDVPALADGGVRYRVDTDRVEADTADPFLNVRTGADSDEPVLAKLPPTYRGLRSTGGLQPAADGGDWIEVELLDPVALESGASLPAGVDNPVGWVNAAFLVPLADGVAVGTDEVQPCREGPDTPSARGGPPAEAYVYGLESIRLGDRCLRVVLTLGAGLAPPSWPDAPAGTGPAPRLPSVSVVESGGDGVTIDLGPITTVWPGATDSGDGAFVVRGNDGRLDLVLPADTTAVTTHELPSAGIVVFDLELASDRRPPSGAGVVLTRQPLVGAGSVSVEGVARPFEALLDAAILDADGRPVEATWSGNTALGTRRADGYGAAVTDWAEAWGRFAIEAAGLEPGAYQLRLGASLDADSLQVPFTVTEPPRSSPAIASDRQQQAAADLIAFARGPEGRLDPVDDAGLADEVVLALGTVEQRRVPVAELADRAAWSFDVEVFNGLTGPFNALDVLATSGPPRISSGEIAHCAAPPLDWPAEWSGLDQVNIEPVAIDSCLQWHGVSLFFGDDGRIAVVALDLWEP